MNGSGGLNGRTTGKDALRFGKPCPVRFNLLVVGETKSGKRTFLKTLFQPYCGFDVVTKVGSHRLGHVRIKEIGNFVLESLNQDCRVHLYDSSGFGDYINNTDAVTTVKEYVENAHRAWYAMDGNRMTEQVRRTAFAASLCFTRIACCFRRESHQTAAFTASSTSSSRITSAP